ncbi:hypothetical protein [Halonotius sp. GCM10025705]|uniref:hypothetical protein n=1 Tax=Halonotius sp. GCM10025705 TaxID=3252678 RepID=UPI003620D408
MERRQYLAAAAAGGAIGVGGVGGYVMLSDDVGFGPPGVPTAPYPPYPTADGDGSIEPISLSGSGQATTDTFALQRDGPTIIDTDAGDAASDERFLVTLVSATDGTEYRVIEVLGPFTGRNLINPPPGEYRLAVKQASADWTATVYDVPAYDTDSGVALEMEPPVVFSDGLDAVLGPINFGTQQPIEFSLSVDADVDYNLSLIDSNGERVELLIQSIVGQTDPQVRDVGGIGYLAVDTNTTWTLRAEPVDDTGS